MAIGGTVYPSPSISKYLPPSGCHRAEARGDQKWSAPRPAPEGKLRSPTPSGVGRLVKPLKVDDFQGRTVNLPFGYLI